MNESSSQPKRFTLDSYIVWLHPLDRELFKMEASIKSIKVLQIFLLPICPEYTVDGINWSQLVTCSLTNL